MKRVLTGVIAIVSLLFVSTVYAGEVGTPKEAQELAEKAEKFFKKNGLDPLVKKILGQDKEFMYKDLYVFISTQKGINVAHGAVPSLAGRNLLNMKDVAGVPLTKKMIEAANSTSGRGWVDYKWPNPKTKKIRDKTTYIIKLDDQHWMGVGAYKN